MYRGIVKICRAIMFTRAILLGLYELRGYIVTVVNFNDMEAIFFLRFSFQIHVVDVLKSCRSFKEKSEETMVCCDTV